MPIVSLLLYEGIRACTSGCPRFPGADWTCSLPGERRRSPAFSKGWTPRRCGSCGWSTRTFRDLKVLQHKATGTADGRWGNWFKNGRANYVTGYHPLFMLGKCVRRALRKPPFLEAIALWAGFWSGYLKQVPRIDDPAAVRYLRRQQLQRLMLRPSIYG